MKESNILLGNATIKQHQKEILLDTKGQHMKELDSHAGIVISNILLGIILQSTKGIYMYNLNFTKTVSLLNHIFPTTDVPKKYKGPPKFDAKNFLEVAISYTLGQNSYKNIGKVLCYNNSISWVNLINSCDNNYSVVKLQS